jgi:hypothetical protein
MATFLATRKMDPALILRIERAIGGTARPARAKLVTARLRTSLLRLVIAVGATALVSTAVMARRRYQEEVSRARAAVLDTVHAQSALVTAEERGFIGRVEPWLLGLAAGYEGDVVTDELRPPRALDAVLGRPSVYVRGPVAAFSSSAAIAETASTSTRDALLLCLLDPPASRAEKVVLAKVRAAYSGGANTGERARRLHDAEAGLKQLLFPWEERVHQARELRDLERIKADVGRVPVEQTKRAAQASLLIAAMDEPDEAGPADLDGERAHQVRVAVIDLRADKVLLRARKRVDPNWLAATTRSNFASAVDGCALAFDVRAVVGR